ncbi:MAG: ComF family protein [Verrucomicrobiota bacterium]|nr:ComF family protein [Verrucomicrobiota bacterium]
MNLIQKIENLIFPEICLLCGEPLDKKEFHGVCDICFSKFQTPMEPLCPLCGGENDTFLDVCKECIRHDRGWKKAYTIFKYKKGARKAIQQYKYSAQTQWLPFFVKSFFTRYPNFQKDIDVIVPIPLHWLKKLLRGFNQSELFCKIISRKAKIPCKNLLKRVKFTRKQASLSADERQKNVKKAFASKKQHIIIGKRILLVDDVFTTGATLQQATEILINAGAESVSVLTLARD